jgi:hypothetical protein
MAVTPEARRALPLSDTWLTAYLCQFHHQYPHLFGVDRATLPGIA